MRSRHSSSRSAHRRIVLGLTFTAALHAFAFEQAFAAGQFTDFPITGFNQELWVVGNPYPDYFVGIAFAPDNGLWTTTSLPDHSLRRWATNPGAPLYGSAYIHPLQSTVVVPGVTRILGLVNHPNGSIYGIAQEGVVQLDASTGAKLLGPSLPAGVPAGKITITVDPVLTSGVNNVVFAVRRAAGGDDPRTAIYSFDPNTHVFTLMYTAPDNDDVDGIAFSPNGQYFFYAVPFHTPSSEIVVLKRTGATLTYAQTIDTGSRGPDGLAFNNCFGFLMSNDANGTLTRYDFPPGPLGFEQTPTITTLASGGFRGDLLGVSPYDGNAYVTQWARTAAFSGTRYDDGMNEANNPSIVQIGPCFNWLPLTLSESHHDPCFGTGATGSIDLSVTGGTPPITYLWSPGGETTQDLSGLSAGTYSVTVTDANNLTASLSVTISQPPQLQLSKVVTNPPCFGGATGSIDLTVSGGTPPYTYLWSPNGQTTQDRNGLIAGTYSVTVTDKNGCTANTTATVTQPPQLQLSTAVTNAACFNGATGAIDLTVTGGTPPYSYQWSPSGQTTQDRSGLVAGNYVVLVTDAHGCTAVTSATVTQPAQLQGSTLVINVGCFGNANGSIDLTVSGGTAPYTYLWSNNATTQDLSGLTAGVYTVAITDAHGCTTTAMALVSQPPLLQLSKVVVGVNCFGNATGAIDLTVSGGTPPYTYLWSNNVTTQDLVGVTAGTYSVTVTDLRGCTVSTSATIQQPPQLLASVEAFPVTVDGGSDGSVSLTVSGGTLPYTYSWSNNATTEDLNGVPAGTYTVTVTDAKGCTVHLSATVVELVLRISATDLLHDAFPFTDDETYVGTVVFDTTSALIKTGRNISAPTGTAARLDVPGDTLVACSCGNEIRLDLVFRILPGPGNYHIKGNRQSGLRPIPTDGVSIATTGSASFWGRYLADNGAFGTGGNGASGPGHPGGVWDPNTWNSARMDTAETNLFPIEARGNLPGLNPCSWAGMYHEGDPKFALLGIAKHRCFLVDTLQALNFTNITCSSVPAWLTAAGSPYKTGYDGNSTTLEYTKILPDGLFTPGTHVEYFIRRSYVDHPDIYTLAPDTNVVTPQWGEILASSSDCSPVGAAACTDGHRWEQFGVLPDRWKHATYGGQGDPCMLYVDLDDGFGDERAWVTAADLIGVTMASKWGAHNGWHVPNLTVNPNNPAYFVRPHIGQPGTLWDMYQVRGVADVINGHAGSLGSRLSMSAALGSPASGKEAHIGPTAHMLLTYYRVLFVNTGRFDNGIFGPFDDRSQDDLATLMSFRQASIGGNPRGLWVEGASFAEAEHANTTAGFTQHDPTIGTLLGGNLASPSYSTTASCPDILTTAASHPSAPGIHLGVDATKLPANDVLLLAPGESSAIPANYVQVPPASQDIASTLIQPYGTTYWTGLLDAWDIQDFRSKNCLGETGRLTYLLDVLANVFGPLCPAYTYPPLAVDPPSTVLRTSLQLQPNPVVSGSAQVLLTMAREGQVDLSITDLAGRRIRSLWSGPRKTGMQSFVWDGRDDQGYAARPGMYFVRARFATERMELTRTVVWLR